MTITSPTGKPITLRPIHPNAGLESEFRKKLERMIDDMQKSVEYHLLRSYRAHEPEMAQDGVFSDMASSFLTKVMKKLAVIWLKRFDDAAPLLAKYFSTSMQKRSDSALRAALKKSGFAVKFQMTPEMEDVLQSTVQQQVALIKSIPQQYLSDVEGLVMRSVQAGRDIGGLADELQKRYGVTRYRAALIARNQNNVATQMMNRARQKELGITEAIWVHSGAGRHPRKSHVAFSGKKYDIDKGALIDGEFIFPGQLINCRCICKSVIPK